MQLSHNPNSNCGSTLFLAIWCVGKPRVSKPPKEKGINKSLVVKFQTEKVTKKRSGSTRPKTKDLSSCTTVPSSKNLEQPRKIQKIQSSLGGPSSDKVGKGKEKENPTLSQKPQVYKKPVNEKPKHHIRWEGTLYSHVLIFYASNSF